MAALTSTPTKVEEVDDFKPTFGKAKEMPKPRRGRRSLDYSAFTTKLQDGETHWIELPEITDEDEAKKSREKWARRIREAANQVDMEAETTHAPEENKLYFKGWKKGEAPARGRRSNDSRATKGKATAKK